MEIDMIVVRKEKAIEKRLRDIIFTIYNRIENNNNAIFSSNGEEYFLNLFLKTDINIVFDVGANMGEYSKLLLKKSKDLNKDIELHIFEPLSTCFNKIQNEFSHGENIFLNNFGISDEEKETEIYFDAAGSSFASLYQRDLSKINKQLNQKEKIKLRRVDNYITEVKIPKIDLLKIDVEGHELNVLKGVGKFLDSDFIKAIQFEYGGANLDSRTYLKDLYNILEPKGYIMCKIMRNSIQPRNYESKMENFQYANYLAVSPLLIND
jgi:FkbM family methyltransferase